MNSSLIVSGVPLATCRLFQFRLRLVLAGSTATPSTRLDPSTYLNPGGKVSTMLIPVRFAPSLLLMVIVYGTSWPRLTFTSDEVLLMETVSARGVSTNTGLLVSIGPGLPRFRCR